MKYLKYVLIVLVLFTLGYFFIAKNTKVLSQTNENLPDIEGDYVISGRAVLNNQEVTLDQEGALGFDQIRDLMNANAGRLWDEFSKDWNAEGGSLANFNPENKPEGQVWRHEGDLSISGDINGKGTIIIRNGNLNITGDLAYTSAGSSIGFIVQNGDINISNDVENLVGAYYADNKISFNQ